MARRSKHPRLPNGYGQIRYLGKNRRNPYGVYPPAVEEYENGQKKPPKAICYVDDWIKGFAILTAYRAGTYVPGMERDLPSDKSADTKRVIQRLLADYNQAQGIRPEEPEPTFKEVFEQYYLKKFKKEYDHKEKKTSMENSIRAAYRNTKELHDKEFKSLTLNDLQSVIDKCPLKHASLELIHVLFRQMYDYAIPNNICDRNYAQYVRIEKPDDDEHGVAFTEDELKKLWAHQDDETVEMLLIMCYSGFRISAYTSIEVNLQYKYFKGGVKTAAGKNRIVPIHSGIHSLVKRRFGRDGSMLNIGPHAFRRSMYKVLDSLDIERHTPHDCRHTFSALCERYGVAENDRKRMLGHKFNDITNDVYGHRDVEDLRTQIEKITISK